jgi:hypothetical protein
MVGINVKEVVVMRQAGRMGEMETWIPNEISPAAIDFITWGKLRRLGKKMKLLRAYPSMLILYKSADNAHVAICAVFLIYLRPMKTPQREEEARTNANLVSEPDKR